MLLETEGINVTLHDAVEEIATMAYLANEQTENIGARRLTNYGKVTGSISFNIPDMDEEEIIDKEYVKEVCR